MRHVKIFEIYSFLRYFKYCTCLICNLQTARYKTAHEMRMRLKRELTFEAELNKINVF